MPDNDFQYYFNTILAKGRKDNTYKFALARFLIEYSSKQTELDIETGINNNESYNIKYSVIAQSFLKYYWHQICKYKIRQNYNLEKLPLIVQIIQRIFGKEYIPKPFESMEKEKIEKAEKEISRECFREVIPRFQNISSGIHVVPHNVFYKYSEDQMSLKPEAVKYFRENYIMLLKLITLEWAKFLEKINIGLPMLISKIQDPDPKRVSLEKFKKVLNIHFHRCFYCNSILSQDKLMIHVDHVIPWSYIYEDEIWNLVLSCRICNLKKHGSLPSKYYIDRLAERNVKYSEKIGMLKKSLMKLDTEDRYKNAIMKHYHSCMDYGFTVLDIKC